MFSACCVIEKGRLKFRRPEIYIWCKSVILQG
nr:MAG TPA: hypothetical protein [Caudoviricetes sp.]